MAKLELQAITKSFGDNTVLRGIDLDVQPGDCIAILGASGSGKSTFLRCLNRMNETIDICRVSGEIKLGDVDIYGRSIDVVPLRAQVGMVFQKPNPFPKSIPEITIKREQIKSIRESLEKSS